MRRRGWGGCREKRVGVISGGEHLSVTHDGIAICPSGGGGEEERTLSHCEAGARVWERSVLGWGGTHSATHTRTLSHTDTHILPPTPRGWRPHRVMECRLSSTPAFISLR